MVSRRQSSAAPFGGCGFLAVLIVLSLTTPLSATPYILGVSWQDGVYRIDPNTGQASLIGKTGFHDLNSLTVDSAGTVWSDGWTSSEYLVRIDPNTGSGTGLRVISGRGATGLAAGNDGFLYAITLQQVAVFRIDTQTGVTGYVDAAFNSRTQSLEFGPDGMLYGWDLYFGLMRVDLSVGGWAGDVNANVGGTAEIQSIAFAFDGQLYGAGRSLYRINRTTGEYTLIAPITGAPDIRGIVFIPEPATLLLLVLGGLRASCRGQTARAGGGRPLGRLRGGCLSWCDMHRAIAGEYPSAERQQRHPI